MSDGAALALTVALLLGNAFFVGAEFALISARRSQIEPLAIEGGRGARTTLWAMERVSLMLAGAQLGITVCSLGLGAVGEPAIAHLLERPFEAVGMPESLLHPIAFVLALGIVVYLHMVLGEMVPKNLALAAPERTALLLGPLLAAVVRIAKPVIWLLNATANGVLRLLRVEPREEVLSAFTAEEVAAMLAESRREGLLDHEEHELLTGALRVGQVQADDLVIGRDELVSIDPAATADQVEDLVARTGFSRFPVRGTEGALRGYVHVKDVLDLEPGCAVPGERIRPLPEIPADATVDDIVQTLQRTGSHLGQVRGSATVLGVVALEDAIEELIGEVVDAAHTGATT
ncbi:MAG: hemolysin family protein [Actinobacteria bacterium]|nr:hemolysin family protein [Actinomycetota bacterium]